MTTDEQLYTLTEPLPHKHLLSLLQLAAYMLRQLPTDPFHDDSGIAVTIDARQAREVIGAILDILQITDPSFAILEREE